jgi:glyoxylase I family protein
MLGVQLPPSSYDADPWQQQAGPTVFAPFASDSGGQHTGTAGWGLNFRVASLDAAVKHLTSAGVEVDVDPTAYPDGRFAQLADPEGNAIQLWEVAPRP